MTANYNRNADAQAYFDSLTRQGILDKLHAIQAEKERDKGEPGAGLPRRPHAMHDSGKAPYTPFDTLGLQAGVALADRLIAAQGGKPRQRIEFWHYLAEWQKGRNVLRPTEET